MKPRPRVYGCPRCGHISEMFGIGNCWQRWPENAPCLGIMELLALTSAEEAAYALGGIAALKALKDEL